MLPDFGYAEDNYILSHHESQNKWRMLTGLLGNSDKFEWLMTFIKLQKMEQQVDRQEA